MTLRFDNFDDAMTHAITLARRGRALVEPNPMVGAVVLDDEGRVISEGWHAEFGGAHAEVGAIAAAGDQTSGRTLIVTLEPCSHHGKTPPCADAVIKAGFRRVIIGCEDPAPHVAGNGIQKLRDAGIEVEVGIQQRAAESLIAPFRRLMLDHRPWVHAKWAMTLDGRIATRTGHSKWITNEAARADVHRQRHLMDAIITGAGTVKADNPRLTARPLENDRITVRRGTKQPLRIVVDSDGTCLDSNSQLVESIDDGGVLLTVRDDRNTAHLEALRTRGVDILHTKTNSKREQLVELLEELGRRQLTHVWLEAGSGLLGEFFDAALIDEVHVFIAPKLVGGRDARIPIGGEGRETVPSLADLEDPLVTQFDGDVLIEGRLRK